MIFLLPWVFIHFYVISKGFSQFHTPLIERIDAPHLMASHLTSLRSSKSSHHPLNSHSVLIQCQQLTTGEGGEGGWEEEEEGRSVARKCLEKWNG